MTNWFESLDTMSQVFAYIAIPATVLLVFQTVLTFIFGNFGSASYESIDADGDCGDGAGTASGDDGLRIFTIRGVIAFFCIFGWMGLVLQTNGVHSAVSIGVATVAGVLFMLLMAYIFATFMKLQANGAVEMTTAVGGTGTVYLPIPASRGGKGKVNVMASGRYSEYNAVTDEESALPTNTTVIVVGVSGDALVVAKK